MEKSPSSTDAFPPKPILNLELWLQNPLRHLFGSPLTRNLLRTLTERCPRCGISVLQREVIASMGGSVEPPCKRCGRLKKLFNIFQSSVRVLTGSDVVWSPLLSFPVARGVQADDPQAFSRAVQAIVRGIAIFGMRRPLPTSVPLTFFWELTGSCNLNCAYCYARDKPFRELNTEECFKLIDELGEEGVVSVTFSGGEPLMRRDFFEVAGYAAKKGLLVFLATNGTMIDRNVARKLKQTGVMYVEISIDSPVKEVHEAFRGKGTFEKAVNGVKYCIDEGIELVTIATTLTAKNKDVDETLEFAKELGVHQVVFLNYVPTRRVAEDLEFEMDPYEREEVLKRILETRQKYTCFKRVAILQATHNVRISREMARGESCSLNQIGFIGIDNPKVSGLFNFMGGCGAGRTMMAMTPDGDLTPCSLLPVKLGNVREDSFVDVWISSPVLAKLRDRKNWEGSCGRCRYKIVCGGARCRAYAYFNNYLAPDPACALNAELFYRLRDEVVGRGRLKA